MQAMRGDMPLLYRIYSASSPVATDLDVVDILVANRAGAVPDFASG
jgi:hypothetical protein